MAVRFITADITAVPIVAMDFAPTLPAREVSARRSTASRNRTSSKVAVPVHSAALTMEESREASPLAGNRALVGASTAVEVSMAEATEEAATGNPVFHLLVARQSTIGEGNHAHKK